MLSLNSSSADDRHSSQRLALLQASSIKAIEASISSRTVETNLSGSVRRTLTSNSLISPSHSDEVVQADS